MIDKDYLKVYLNNLNSYSSPQLIKEDAKNRVFSFYINKWPVKTYDEKLENPYEVTEYIFSNPDLLQRIIFRNYSSSADIRLAIIKAVKKFTEDGGNFTVKMQDQILKYVSFLGGAYILDSFTQEELTEKVYDKLIDLFVEANPQQKVFKLD